MKFYDQMVHMTARWRHGINQRLLECGSCGFWLNCMGLVSNYSGVVCHVTIINVLLLWFNQGDSI